MEERENRFGTIIERNVAIPVRDGHVAGQCIPA